MKSHHHDWNFAAVPCTAAAEAVARVSVCATETNSFIRQQGDSGAMGIIIHEVLLFVCLLVI